MIFQKYIILVFNCSIAWYRRIAKYLILIFYHSDKTKPLCTEAFHSFPSRTSQVGFLNLKEPNIMWTFHVNNNKMWYTWLILSSLLWFMLYKAGYASIMFHACHVTAWVREGQQ